LAIAGVALVAIMFYTWTYFSRQSKVLDSERWDKLDDLNAANAWSVKEDDFDKFAKEKENAGTAQARLARFELARYGMQKTRELASSLGRKEAIESVKKARDLYKQLIDESNDVPPLAQEAIMGTAKGSEALGEVDQAKTYYEKLVKEYPQSVFGKDAAKQLERLNKDGQDVDALKTLFEKKGL
jgi:tetratricopeptide (TPR) repeat protein